MMLKVKSHRKKKEVMAALNKNCPTVPPFVGQSVCPVVAALIITQLVGEVKDERRSWLTLKMPKVVPGVE